MVIIQFLSRLQERLLMTIEDGRNRRIQFNASALAIRSQTSKEKIVSNVVIKLFRCN